MEMEEKWVENTRNQGSYQPATTTRILPTTRPFFFPLMFMSVIEALPQTYQSPSSALFPINDLLGQLESNPSCLSQHCNTSSPMLELNLPASTIFPCKMPTSPHRDYLVLQLLLVTWEGCDVVALISKILTMSAMSPKDKYLRERFNHNAPSSIKAG
jgi:hypothetical protein